MSGTTSGLLWTFGSLVATGLLILAVAWPVTVIMRARISRDREEGYRTLSQGCLDSQRVVEQRLAEIAGELSATRAQLAEIRRVLTDVE